MPTRRSLLLSAAAAPLAATTAKAAYRGRGEAPPTEPAASILRLKVGDTVVTALLDGNVSLPLAVFPAASEAEAKAVLDRDLAPSPPNIAVNAFLVQTGRRTVLIDTGGGTKLGPTLGRLPWALTAAGVSPAEIDTVAMTHLHTDHVFGLTTPRGVAAFPNAELVVHAVEHAF